uniref:Uncharacterized protein n=1 Tax=Panagrolaimus superbus TaxID=310955 RepID=A0A914ZA67_9BILA
MNDCSQSPMIVETYKVEGKNKKGPLVHSTKAFVNGNGYIDYSIRDNRQAVIVGRVGVLCSFGECGARGKRSAVIRGDRR